MIKPSPTTFLCTDSTSAATEKCYPVIILREVVWPWNLFGHSLHSSEPGEDRRTGAGHQDWLSLVVSNAGQWSHSACAAACVRMCEPRIPQSPGVICVIITIITLRLQEISTMASEEKPCLCSMTTTDGAYKEHAAWIHISWMIDGQTGSQVEELGGKENLISFVLPAKWHFTKNRHVGPWNIKNWSEKRGQTRRREALFILQQFKSLHSAALCLCLCYGATFRMIQHAFLCHAVSRCFTSVCILKNSGHLNKSNKWLNLFFCLHVCKWTELHSLLGRPLSH